jgi:hypothetical protein
LEAWNLVYDYLVGHGFSRKAVIHGVGAAAGEAYQWAIINPDKVSCIFAVNPIMRSMLAEVQPLNNLAPLARAEIPILHLVGEFDPALPNQTQEVERRYKALGGNITVIVMQGEANILTQIRDLRPVIGFLNKYNR